MSRRPNPRGRRTSIQPAGHDLIYGWHSTLAALQNPQRRLHKLLATPNALQRLAQLALSNLPAPSDPRDIDRLAGAGAVHQGIAGLFAPLPERALDELVRARLVVVLDQVTDPHNVGAILRTAAAFGCDALVMTERHGPAESGVLAKAASGGLEHVALIRVKNLARALNELRDMGLLSVGLDSSAEQSLEELAPRESTALVLGAEGKGLRQLTRERCDHMARLELPGPIQSLNVSNAAALALYAVTRRR